LKYGCFSSLVVVVRRPIQIRRHFDFFGANNSSDKPLGRKFHVGREVKVRRLPCGGSEKVHCQQDRNEKKLRCDYAKFGGLMLYKNN
jgi:urease beta subunit